MAENFAEGVVVLRAEGLDQIEAAAKKASDAAKKTAEEIGGIEKALKKQIAQFGLNSKEIAVWELRAKGATTAQINGIMALTAQYEKLAAKQKSQADAAAALHRTAGAVNEVTEALKKQVATFGMSSDKIQLWELKQKGATASQLIEVQKLQKEYAKLQQIQEQQIAAAAKAANPMSGPTKGPAGGGMFGGIKSLAQGSSQITGVIGGLAALGGVKMAADALSNLSKKAIDLRGAFERGEITSSEFNDQMARAVPIAGSLYSAVTDGTRALQDYYAWSVKSAGGSDALARSLESAATRAERAKKELQAIKDLRELGRDLTQTGQRLGGDQWDGAFSGAQDRHDDAVKKAQELYDAGVKAGGDGEGKLRKARDDAKWAADQNLAEENRLITNQREMSQREELAGKGILVDPMADRVDVDRLHAAERDKADAIRENERLAGSEVGITDAIRDRIKALNEENAAWGKKGLAAERAIMVAKNAPAAEIAAIDAAIEKRKALEAADKSRGRRLGNMMGGAANVFGAAAENVGKVGGEFAGAGNKTLNEFNSLIKQLDENVRFKGMTDDQKAVARFKEQGVGGDDLAKLAALQAKQEKQQAQTQFLSASGLADHMQSLIGNAPDTKALKAAEKTAEATDKAAKCVDGNTMKVTIMKMPDIVATYG